MNIDVCSNTRLTGVSGVRLVISVWLAALFVLLPVAAVQAVDMDVDGAITEEADPAVEVVEEPTPAPSSLIEIPKHVLKKTPKHVAMKTSIMHKTLVQDVVRVGERIFLAGERGHIGWSDDHGKTWTQAKVPTYQDINALYFVSSELGWAVGHDGNIFNTIDGGKTWKMQVDGITFNLERAKDKLDRFSAQLEEKQADYDAVTALLDDTLLKQEELQAELDEAEAAGRSTRTLEKKLAALEEELVPLEDLQFELDDEVFELDFQVRDAESILTEENAPWPLMDVWFSDHNTGYAVGAFGAFLKTVDGGENWENIAPLLDNPDGFHLNAVEGLDSSIFVVGEAGLIFRSQDDGATWETLDSPDDGSFFTIHLARTDNSAVVMDFESGTIAEEAGADAEDAIQVIIAGLEGYVYRSTDSGASWSLMEHGLRYNLNGMYVDDEEGLILIVGNDGAIVYSTDGGETLQTHRLVTQVTMSSVTVAANGTYVMGSASGIMLKSKEFKD